ncbi:MAG: hypothetical protein JNM63_02450, partial [Spirochaetia bacterium]|nr:hypothetical protein [Spirochaetia bacterium]
MKKRLLLKWYFKVMWVGLLQVGAAFAAVAENGLTTIEAASDTATLSYASEWVVTGADFYTASSSWGNLFPRKETTTKFEKKGSGLLVKLSDKTGNLAEQSYVALTNGGRMEVSTTLVPGDLAKYLIWDVFLSRPLFAGATLRRSGSKDLVLDTNHWETIEVDEFTLVTEAGEWRFVLGGDAGVKWKLRSVCDRLWGPPEKRTFSLLWQFENIPSTGTKIHLSVDMVLSPKASWLAAKGEGRVAEYFESLGLRYGAAPPKTKKMDIASLSAEAARRSSARGENRLDPRSPSVIPLPKKMTPGKGVFAFNEGRVASSSSEGAFSLLSEELASRGLGLKRASSGEAASVVLGQIGEPAVTAAAKKLGMNLEALKGKSEAYALLVKEDSILVAGTELRALVHGIQSLRQLIRTGANGAEVPAVEILDSPDLAFRGFYLEAGGGIMGTDDFRRILRNTYSRFHANAVMVEIPWSRIQWKSHPEIAGPNARSLADLTASAKEAQSLGIEFIPAIFSYGKVQELLKHHPEIAEVSNWQKQGDAWCPNKPETYALFFDLMEELVAATGCRRVHIGHDEIQGMRLCETCRAVPADELFAGDV